MENSDAERIADEIIALFKLKGGANYSGEEVTQLEHACQAAQLAEQDGNDDEVILASFLHDLGHLLDEEEGMDDMDGYGVKDHEAVGADFLKARGFSDKLTTLIKSHVEAKRYLCAVNKRYYDNLSYASKMTLQFQGGMMNGAEVKTFEAHPLKNLIIKMRTWDEAAKEKNVPLPDLEIYRNKIVALLSV